MSVEQIKDPAEDFYNGYDARRRRAVRRTVAGGDRPCLYGGAYLKDLRGENKNPPLGNCRFRLSEYGPDAHALQGVGNRDRDLFNAEMDELTKL